MKKTENMTQDAKPEISPDAKHIVTNLWLILVGLPVFCGVMYWLLK